MAKCILINTKHSSCTYFKINLLKKKEVCVKKGLNKKKYDTALKLSEQTIRTHVLYSRASANQFNIL